MELDRTIPPIEGVTPFEVSEEARQKLVERLARGKFQSARTGLSLALEAVNLTTRLYGDKPDIYLAIAEIYQTGIKTFSAGYESSPAIRAPDFEPTMGIFQDSYRHALDTHIKLRQSERLLNDNS